MKKRRELKQKGEIYRDKNIGAEKEMKRQRKGKRKKCRKERREKGMKERREGEKESEI